jgi:hypothetical protein
MKHKKTIAAQKIYFLNENRTASAAAEAVVCYE